MYFRHGEHIRYDVAYPYRAMKNNVGNFCRRTETCESEKSSRPPLFDLTLATADSELEPK
jgi:hypothetical protein